MIASGIFSFNFKIKLKTLWIELKYIFSVFTEYTVIIDESLLNSLLAKCCSPTNHWSHEFVGHFCGLETENFTKQKVGQTTMDHSQKPEQVKVVFAWMKHFQLPS